MVLAGRDARRSRANVRHPATAQVPTAQPFVLDGLPGTTPCRPRSVAGRGRAFGACCFAGKLRSPAGPARSHRGQGPRPLRHSLRQPYVIPYAQGVRTPGFAGRAHQCWSVPLRGASQPQKPRLTGPPQGSGAARPQGALRAIDSTACPHSWRTCGPRRLRRQSDADGIATERGCSVAEGVEAASGRSDGLGGMASASSCTSCLATARS